MFHLTRFRLAPYELVTLLHKRDNDDTRVAAYRGLVPVSLKERLALLPWFSHLYLNGDPAKQKHCLLAREPRRSPA
jgi:hypothetical protein